MSTLTDRDIRRILGRDFVVEPCREECITPTGYDLTLGQGVPMVDIGALAIYQKDGVLVVPPNSSAVVLTGEQVWLSHRLIGTLHSRGTLAARGLIVNSTTVDPNWQGVLVFRLFNTTDQPIEVRLGETFVTLMLHRASTPTTSKDFREPRVMLQNFVSDASLRGLLTDYLAALSSREFNEQVAKARSATLVVDSINRWISSVPSWLSVTISWMYGLLLAFAAGISGLSLLNWDFVRTQIKRFGSDPGAMNAQTVVAACSLLLVAISGLRAHGRRSN